VRAFDREYLGELVRRVVARWRKRFDHAGGYRARGRDYPREERRASGAAIYNGNGTLTINNSTFSGNVSSGEGGAIRSSGTLVITNSTFTGNSGVRGGALYFAGNAPGGTETAAITNSTFSGNSATLMGGAISLSGSTAAVGAMTLTHVTIANNAVTGGGGVGGGIYKDQTGGFNIDRSIFANNTAPTGPNCNAAGAQFFNSLNYNVIGSTNNCTTNGTTTNNFVGAVALNALAGNGGPTQTISLPAYSPARDRAPTCATPTDQRGAARPLGIQCDSGAVEASPTVPQAPTIGTGTGGNDAASVTLNDTTPADLSLGNTASQEPVADGVTFAYTIVVANYGPASATGVTVTDTLPAGVTLVSATSSQGSCIGTTSVACSLGTMSAGGTAEIALVVIKTTGGPLSNVAAVTANEADPNRANNSHGEVTTPVELLGFQIE
jgi:uncharacterized repeat protein (TIGR01451 family)